jgi:hypothetical protein
MPATYTLISSNVLTSSAASVTFSAIPSTYTDLVVRASPKSDGSNTGFEYMNTRFNGTTSGYSLTRIRTSGASTIDSANLSSQAQLLNGWVDDSVPTSTFGSIELYIPSYTASQNKPLSVFGVSEQNTTSVAIQILANLWSNTAAITSINFYPLYGSNWVSGSSFYLYGISNA